MGCKPSKETLRATASADEEHRNRSTHRIKQSGMIENVIEHQQIIKLKDSDNEEESSPLSNSKGGPTSEEEEEKAAIVIQSKYRGYKTRKEMAVDQQPSKAELEAEFSADDRELCKAATKIQASFRGHQVRAGKGVSGGSGAKEEVEELSQDMEKMAQKTVEDELADIDLADPELHKAATKIQASFRGHKVRKDDH